MAATVTFTQDTLFAGAVRAIGSTLSVSDQDAQMLVDLGVATAPGLTPQIGSVAGALISGFAPLVSPALSGTPTSTTASLGSNTTQIATTAFVQQEAPAVVTRSEIRSLAFVSYVANSGSGQTSAFNVGAGYREIYLGSLAAGRGSFQYGIVGTSGAQPCMSRSDSLKLNFGKKIWLSGKTMTGGTLFGTNYIGDANTMCRITLGGYSANGTGDMSSMGIGWKKVGGTSPFFTLTVHNGTTLTDVATTIQQSALKTIDWVIYSDGAGNVTFYIDGVQAATTSAGPTGITATAACNYREQVEAVSTPSVRQIMHNVGGWLYIEG